MPNTPNIDSAIADYDRLAEDLAGSYAKLGFERFRDFHVDLLPALPARVLDIGAGGGQTAAGLADMGYEVMAVEPSSGMREQALKLFPDPKVSWIDDRLPNLSKVKALSKPFDFVLLNAVWMHVPPDLRQTAMASVAALSAPGAVLTVALRHGPSPEGRQMHEADADPFIELAAEQGLTVIRRKETGDPLKRGDGVTFTRLCLRKG